MRNLVTAASDVSRNEVAGMIPFDEGQRSFVCLRSVCWPLLGSSQEEGTAHINHTVSLQQIFSQLPWYFGPRGVICPGSSFTFLNCSRK